MRKILAVIGILSMMLMGIIVLKDDVIIEKIETNMAVQPSKDVTNQFGELTVNGFEWLSDEVKWLSSVEIAFVGQHANGETMPYTLNTQSLELKDGGLASDSAVQITLYETPTMMVFLGDNGLVALKDTEEHLIAEKNAYDENHGIIVSANEDKIGYVDKRIHTYVTYDVSNKKYAKLHYKKGKIDEVSHHLRQVFSDDGGFILFESRSSEEDEDLVNILGADSGRYYGQAIKGRGAEFSPDGKKVAFIYTGVSPNTDQSQKIGLFVLKYKKIIYLDSLLEGEVIFDKLVWSTNSRFIYGVVKNDRGYQIKLFDIENGTSHGIAFELPHAINSLDYFNKVNNQVYIVYNKHQLMVFDLETGRYRFQDDLLKMNKTSYLYSLGESDVLLMTAKSFLVLSEVTSRVVSSYRGDVENIYLSPDKTRLCYLLKADKEMQLKVVTIKKVL